MIRAYLSILPEAVAVALFIACAVTWLAILKIT